LAKFFIIVIIVLNKFSYYIIGVIKKYKNLYYINCIVDVIEKY